MPTPAVRPCAPDDLPGLCAAYNGLVVGRVPHCGPVSAAEMGPVLAAPTLTIEREGARLTEQAVLVAGAGGALRGFIHLGIQAPDERGPSGGVVRFLAYPRGQRALGDALLAAGQAWLRARGAATVRVIPQPWRYEFYGYAHAFLSDHLDHVQALLRCRGYRKTGGEVFLDWPDMAPVAPGPVPGLAFDVTLEELPGAGLRPGLRLRAVQGDEILGVCLLKSASEFSRAPQAQDVAFCDWLGVKEPWQGRGLGRFLLASALCQARARGYRDAAISTAHDNDRAFLFYTNCGFQVVDWTYEFGRDLT